MSSSSPSASVPVPQPLPPAFVAALQAAFSSGSILTSREDLIPYGFDGTAALKQLPGVVVFPKDAASVSAVLKLARTHRVPVVTRGSGTGLSGGSVPVPGCVVLCLADMNRILELDAKTSRCPPSRA